jgi:glutamate synthase (NADPH/NADH) large chain
MGICSLDGYRGSRLFEAVGLAESLVEYYLPGVVSRLGGLDLEDIYDDIRARRALGASHQRDPDLGVYRKEVWQELQTAARGHDPGAYERFLGLIAETPPVYLRDLLRLRPAERPLPLEEVAPEPELIAACFRGAAMSHGALHRVAHRAIAAAFNRFGAASNCGEGGEDPRRDRGGPWEESRSRIRQVASGRFEVDARYLVSADELSIKIGQGAKPGEGGLLPGFKVTDLIAQTRHTPRGIDLISPSNNHDIYSIEDLAQVIEELKTANPHAKVSVKIPAVPFIGPIATGIAKAHADIIAISGYDGGTGAARKHALRHVGMPVEIGVKEAHRALLKAGLRDRVEIWADGGIKSGLDVIKLILLGANRVGFGTMAMAAVGCTSCRECNTGTCHVGITAHIPTMEAAHEMGVKKYTPREYDKSVEGLVNFFTAVTNEVGVLTMRLGYTRTQDLVGRSDLMKQTRGLDLIDLEYLLKGVEVTEAFEPEELREDHIGRAHRPRTSLTKIVSDEIYNLIEKGKSIAIFEDDKVSSVDRSLGTHLSGKLSRANFKGGIPAHFKRAILHFTEGSISGNGLGAFNAEGVDIIVEGGVQDGAAKSCGGGQIAILKGLNHDGIRVDGAVGKCFGYGAQGGTLVVQGDADSRAGIRLSGADLIIGGRVREPLSDDLGCIASRANIKGFAFEYMTSGRGLVLGDPGPWLCSGMTGGVVYLHLDRRLGLDEDALSRRLAKGAEVVIEPVAGAEDERNIRELLSRYISVLGAHEQKEEAEEVRQILHEWQTRFVKAVPKRK